MEVREDLVFSSNLYIVNSNSPHKGHRKYRTTRPECHDLIQQAVDEIFNSVHKANQASDEDPESLRISIDTKAKAKIGEFSRAGRRRGKAAEQALDHDIEPDEVLVPFGILIVMTGSLTIVFGRKQFAKSRLLPLHPSTRSRLEDYLKRRLHEASTCALVFISVKGVQLHANTVRGVFRRLVNALGIAPSKRRARLHDLRFYFPNQALTNSPADHHRSISRPRGALTTYLGHSDVRNSYWYLEITPALFSTIAQRCEDFAKGGNP